MMKLLPRPSLATMTTAFYIRSYNLRDSTAVSQLIFSELCHHITTICHRKSEWWTKVESHFGFNFCLTLLCFELSSRLLVHNMSTKLHYFCVIYSLENFVLHQTIENCSTLFNWDHIEMKTVGKLFLSAFCILILICIQLKDFKWHRNNNTYFENDILCASFNWVCVCSSNCRQCQINWHTMHFIAMVQ